MQNEQKTIEAAAQSYAEETAQKEHKGLESIKEDFIAGAIFWGNSTVDLLKSLSPGIQELAVERQKQIDKHGFTAEHHVDHTEWYADNQLQDAAVKLLAMDVIPGFSDVIPPTPERWDEDWFTNLAMRSQKERLIISGALIAAELDRLNEIEKNLNQ